MKSNDEKQFESSLRRGFAVWITAIIVAPSVLVALNPHKIGAYLIAFVFVPRVFMAFRRRANLKLSSDLEILLPKWIEAGRPKVYSLPYQLSALILTARTESTALPVDDGENLKENYRQMLRSKLRIELKLFGILLILMPLVFSSVRLAMQLPVNFDSLIIPFGTPLVAILILVLQIYRENKSLSRFDEWVTSGCPKTFKLDKI